MLVKFHTSQGPARQPKPKVGDEPKADRRLLMVMVNHFLEAELSVAKVSNTSPAIAPDAGITQVNSNCLTGLFSAYGAAAESGY